jgi:hypothetical protein
MGPAMHLPSAEVFVCFSNACFCSSMLQQAWGREHLRLHSWPVVCANCAALDQPLLDSRTAHWLVAVIQCSEALVRWQHQPSPCMCWYVLAVAVPLMVLRVQPVLPDLRHRQPGSVRLHMQCRVSDWFVLLTAQKTSIVDQHLAGAHTSAC